jgi:hypothetical protein
MVGTALLFRANNGVAGDLSRQSQEKSIEPQVLNSSLPFPGYGLPGKISSNKFVPIAGSEVATDIYGFIVRPFPTTGANASDALGTSVPPTTGIANVLKSGYILVKSNNGTPALNGAVYVRTANASGAKVVGGIEATAELTFTGGTITGTGTGTIAGSVTAAAIVGTWSLTLQTTSGTSKVTVIDPNGVRHADATVGTAYTSGGVTFTITAGGTMTAGDSFAPVVTANTLAIPDAYFTGAKDANGIAEIAYNI